MLLCHVIKGMSTSLTVTNLCKQFEHRVVLRNVSFSVANGHALVVTGPNGSGKTTLMRILSGLMLPTSGAASLEIDGTVVDFDERRREVGFVTPEVHVYPELTPVENLKFFHTVRGLEWDEAEAAHWLRRVGLDARRDDPVGNFSSGMKQRVKLICALAHHPSLLLLDEPGANLDERGRESLSGMVEIQRKRGMTIIATNDPKELTLGDEIVALRA